MRPLLSYYGGKQKMAKHILPLIDRIPHTVYVEPFCGGAAVLFAKPKKAVGRSTDYSEVINDLNGLIINFYRMAKRHPVELTKLIDETLYSREDHIRSIEIWKNPDKYDELTRAWAVFVNLNQGFAKMANGGWGTTVFGSESSLWDNRKSRLTDQMERLSEVHIECKDALEVIATWDSPQTLFYCDPPYPETACGHYEGYTVEDYTKLCGVLDRCQGSYILSNYPQDVHPETGIKTEIQITCSASGKGKVGKNRDKSKAAEGVEELGNRDRTEILWVCNRSERMRGELKMITNRPIQLELI